ncbi:MAG: hypothetical protein JKX85_03085 [Phycisphaeraceae bacterium]|nr:hypothetical protein [Phycisphaeraceae bacterium]
MMLFTHIAMLGWIPVAMGLFLLLKPRRAVMAGYILAMLFLPNYQYEIPKLMDYTKFTAASMGLLMAAMLFDWRTITNFRPHWVDIPVVIWCVVPFFSSMANDMGIHDYYGFYDGMSSSLYQTFIWGVPYFLGRVYITDHQCLKELAIAIIIGALIYAPLCWFEIRMSPQLHNWLYGFTQHRFGQARRGDGWRPMVFQQHGLALGMLMGMSAMTAGWLWRARTIKKIGSLPIAAVAIFLLVTVVFIKSSFAMVLVLTGVIAYYAVKILRHPLPLLILVFMIPCYQYTRVSGSFSGETLVNLAQTVFNSDRASSLQFRLDNEDVIIEHVAKAKPWLGWGTWGDYRVDEDNIPDGMWVITYGKYGIIGLVSLTLTLLTGPIVMLLGLPRKYLRVPDAAPALALTTIMVLFTYDTLMNSFPNPIFGLVGGGVACVGRLYWQHHSDHQSWFQVLIWRIFRSKQR